MTAIWGPLGWMTLHSVSTIYPANPTPAEQQLVSQWLDLFHACITCPSCRDHFGQMLVQLRSMYPTMLRSRAEFVAAICRAHNTVNRRLDKPVYLTISECMNVYRNNLSTRSARDYRHAYLRHIQRDWSLMRDANGIVGVRKVQELVRLENEYWGVRDHGEIPEIADEPVAPLPRPQGESGQPRAVPLMPTRSMGPVRFVGGRFQFGRK